MDTDFIAAIVVALVGAFIGWAEKRMSSGKRAKKREVERQTQPHTVPAATAPTAFLNGESATLSTSLSARPSVPAQVHSLDETDDIVEQPRQSSGLSPLGRDKLRDAIIWGEILKRKF